MSITSNCVGLYCEMNSRQLLEQEHTYWSRYKMTRLNSAIELMLAVLSSLCDV